MCHSLPGWVSYSTSASDSAVSAVQAPVDDAVALVDQALVGQVYEYLADRLGQPSSMGEALAVPSRRRYRAFKLADNAAARTWSLPYIRA